ncbi:DUF4190 domain-containing protein [Senimuribacter intestinalis]|jgi:hypothetical protein|uniref:DUF4190 domain-containing protein n=1 Tax=Senimuribacter intestinalis TaxID=2941507 RepID=UPI00203CE8C7|nr:DUF4190 domain-containing protein [Senimuribacter intestinalis]
MFCSNCGKEMPNGATFCPECGAEHTTQAAAQQYMHVQESKPEVNTYIPENQAKSAGNNTMCVVGMVISLISLLINPFALIGIAGIVVSVIGLVQISKNPENGKAKAVTGIAVGAVSTIYFCIQIMSLANYTSYY